VLPTSTPSTGKPSADALGAKLAEAARRTQPTTTRRMLTQEIRERPCCRSR
jgi:hypothetical protein